jgi:hypothetical protein
VTAALAETVARPRWWALALAAFLVRGGIVLVAIPIVVPPSIADLGSSLGPLVLRVALGSPTALVAAAAVSSIVIVAVLLALGAVGAWFEQALVADAAGTLADGPPASAVPAPDPSGSTFAALAARLVAHAPTAIALGWAGARIGNVAYAELLTPSGTGSTIGRIVAGAPEAFVGPVVVWAIAELVGGVAARRVGGLEEATVPAVVRVVASSAAEVIRRPRVALAWLGGTAAVVLALAASWASAAISFDRLRGALVDEPTAGGVGPALLSLVVTWIVGLAVVGLALAWRSVAVTRAVRGPSSGASAASAPGEPLPG